MTIQKRIRAYRSMKVLRLVQKIRTCKGEKNQTIRALKKRSCFRRDKNKEIIPKNLSFFLPENRPVGMHKLIKKERKDGKRQKARKKCRSDALRKSGAEEDEEAEQIW